ncbi:hypothetical protein [Streptomyces sp. NPDC005096]|uniref:hypothetical protein n=1 Tax=Streptomyces sp. NPDC005096 TaxID=3154559 RepID=UPI0033AC88AF
MTETKPLPVRGRPTLLTANLIKSIADAVEEGKTRREVAAAAGVSYASLRRWLSDGRRLRDAGADRSKLRGHEWLCLRLVRTVEAAEERREKARAKQEDVLTVAAPAELQPEPVIEIGRPRGRVRSWLRSQLRRAADSL